MATQREQILKQASEWLMRLQDGELSAEEREALQQWQQQSPLHQKVWEKASLLHRKFSDIPVDIAVPILQKTASASHQSYKKYIWILAILPSMLVLYYINDDQQWLADQRSGTGERKSITLPDGGEVLLNANSAIDIQYSSGQRKVILRKGEIWIKTHHDSAQRPFYIQTKQGTAQALGTEYLVKMTPQYSSVMVQQGTVRIQPKRSHATQLIQKNQQAIFDNQHIQNIQALDLAQTAWTKGFLMVNELALEDFMQRLRPYQKGMIQVDPTVAQIKISGTYPIDDLTVVYRMLMQTYPVKIQSHAADYWITVDKK